MRRAPSAFVAAVLGVALLANSGRHTRAQETVSYPSEGVTYLDRVAHEPRDVHMRVVQIDLRASGLRFKLSPPAGPDEVLRQTPLEFLKQERAQIAINAHYFLPWPSTDPPAHVIGIAVSDGRAFSAFEAPSQSYALTTDAPGINIDLENRASVVHRDPAQPDGLHVIEPARLWTTLAGSAQIVTNGEPTVPDYRDAARPTALLTPGGPNQYSNERSWYDAINARTAIALSRDANTLTLFTVDARGDSRGLSVRELAALLIRDYRAWNALNLDGGGSTSLAMEDPRSHVAAIVNVSSDNPMGRAVGTSLAVFARSRP